MKEFVEKLIEKLEEELKYQNIKAYEAEADKILSEREHRQKCAKCFDAAILIVNQLAEEYNPSKSKSLDKGWIPCSERLPEEANDYFVTQYNENAIDEYCDGYRTSTIFFNGVWWDDIDCGFGWKIIAWQTLPNPYKPEEKQEEAQPNFYTERFNKVL